MHRPALTGLLAALLAASSGAQNPPVLTEAGFLSVLDDAHPAVLESAESVARAEARLLASRTLENPVVGAVREDPEGPGRQTDLVVSWQLPDAAKRPEVGSREQELEAARTRFAGQVLAHRLAMRKAYADWAVADARRRRLSAQAERVASLAQREAARTDRGEASGLDAHRLRLAATGLRARVALAAAESERARAEAATWYPELPADVHPVLPEVPDAPSFDEPDTRVRAAAADLEAARLAREAAGRFVASPEVSLGWQSEEVGRDSIDGPIVGLSWSVPLFDRRRAARDAADASLDAATARLELARRAANASRGGAQTSFAQLSSALVRTGRELEANERMLDGAEAAFRHGEASLTDLLETHRSVTEAELTMLDLHEAALEAHRELERLAGSTGPIASTNDAPTRSPSRENTP